MYKDNYNQISGKNANKRNNIHICTYTDKDLSRGLRRIPITLCNKDKLLHLGNPQKHLSRIVNCIHFLDDGLCNLHEGFCANLKPKIHYVKRLKCPFCTSENTRKTNKSKFYEIPDNECLNCGYLWDNVDKAKAKEYTPKNTLLTTKKVDKLIGLMADIKTDKDKLIIEIAFGDFDIALSGHGKTYAKRLKKELMDMVD